MILFIGRQLLSKMSIRSKQHAHHAHTRTRTQAHSQAHAHSHGAGYTCRNHSMILLT